MRKWRARRNAGHGVAAEPKPPPTLAYLLLTESLTGALGTVLGIVAIVLLLTAVIGICPAYLLFKIMTLKKAEAPR